MNKQILNFTANEQILTVDEPIRISTNKVNYIEAHFDLGQNWSGYDSVRAVWFNDFNCISTVLDSLGNCAVPFEVMKRKGCVKVNLVGSISEDDVLTDRLTSYPIIAVIVDCAAQITGANTSPITPSEYEQFVQAVKDDADRAEQGASEAETSAQNASDSATSAHDDKIAIEQAIAEVIQQIEEFEQVQVVVNTLPPSSQATSDFTDGVLTLGVPQGVKGDTGNGIQSIAKTGTSGLVDTYTITFTDGQTTTFNVTNGAKGDTGNGIQSIAKTSTVGLVDTYTITYTNGTTTTFTVTNGEKGDKGDTGEVSHAELDSAVSDLKSDINDIRRRVNLFDKTKITLGFHKQDMGTPYGTARGLSGDEDNYFYSDLIPVAGSETIWTNSVFTGVHPIYVLEFDSSQLVIASHTNFNTSFVTNANAKYVCFSSRQTEIDENIISRERLDYYRPFSDCDILSSQIVTKRVGDLTDSKYLINGYIFRGDLPNVFPYDTNASYTVSHLISVGDNSKVVFINNSSVVGYCMLRAAIEGGAKTQITIAANGKTEIDLSGYNYFAFEMQTAAISQLNAYFYDEYTDDASVSDYLDKMQLKSLKIVFDGDSVTEGAGVSEISTGIAPNNNKGWPYSIQNLCKNSICYGYGKSGWRIGKIANESPSTSLLEHISQYPEDVDVFVLSGGYNDQAQQMALGEIVEHKYYTATYDEYTTIGALESWICQLRQAYPLAKIIYVITGTRTFPSDDDTLHTNRDTKGNIITDLYTTQNERFELFFNSIEKVLNKWGIPYVDFRKEAGIEGTGEPTVPINIQMWENAGGLHPTKICYDTHLVPKILNKIRSII